MEGRIRAIYALDGVFLVGSYFQDGKYLTSEVADMRYPQRERVGVILSPSNWKTWRRRSISTLRTRSLTSGETPRP